MRRGSRCAPFNAVLPSDFLEHAADLRAVSKILLECLLRYVRVATNRVSAATPASRSSATSAAETQEIQLLREGIRITTRR
jgi:hypothetical protein